MKKRGLFLVALIGILSMVVVGCQKEDPIPGSLFTQNIAPGIRGDYDVGEVDNPYINGYFVNLFASLFTVDNLTTGHIVADNITLTSFDPIILEGDAKVWIELRSDVDFESVRAQGKPTWIKRGIVGGWSLPIYNNDNEELYFMIHVPHRWDGSSDILVHVHCYLGVANAKKNFNLQLSWESFRDGDIVPNTSNDLAEETATEAGAQYQSYHVSYFVDYDIVPANPIASTDELHLRVRRLAATVDEIAGEVIVTHVGVLFHRDKLGSPTP